MNKIKKYRTFTLNKDIAEERTLTYLEERTPAGIVILKEEYDLNGDLKSRMKRELDEKGRVALELQFSEDTEDPDQESVYSYNEQNKIKAIQIKYRDNSSSFREYSYDESENSQTIMIRDESNELEGKEYRKFDDQGRMIHEEMYGWEESFVSHIEIVYDDYDNYLERYFEYPDDFIREYFYKYVRNDKAQVVKIQVVDAENKLAREDFMDYDERGNLTVHRFTDFEQNVVETKKYDFDEKDRVRKEELFGADESLLESTEYLYREDGVLLEEHNSSVNGDVSLYFEYEFFDEAS